MINEMDTLEKALLAAIILVILLISWYYFFPSKQVSPFPKVTGPGPDLYILAGQSNMAGRGHLEEEDRTTVPLIHMLDKDDAWRLATEPLHFDKIQHGDCISPDGDPSGNPGGKVSCQGMGPGFEFARQLHKKTGRPIGLIPTAIGGSSVSRWVNVPGYSGVIQDFDPNAYGDSIRRAKLAEQLSGGKIRGILWIQGESDGSKTQGLENGKGVYLGALTKLFDQYRRDLGRHIPVFLGNLAAWNSSRRTINDWISEYKYFGKKHVDYDLSDMGMYRKAKDTAHVNRTGNLIAGKKFAEDVYATLY